MLVDLSSESLDLAWEWIAARRDPTKTLEEALLLAPKAWQRWVKIRADCQGSDPATDESQHNVHGC